MLWPIVQVSSCSPCRSSVCVVTLAMRVYEDWRSYADFLVTELHRFAGMHREQPDLRTCAIAGALRLIAGRQESDVPPVPRPGGRAIAIAAEQLAMIGAIGTGNPDRGDALIVGPLFQLRLHIDHLTSIR